MDTAAELLVKLEGKLEALQEIATYCAKRVEQLNEVKGKVTLSKSARVKKEKKAA